MTTTRLAFDAKIAGVTVRPPKEAGGKGRFDLTLTIEQPDPPNPPSIPWKFVAEQDRSAWKDRPEDTSNDGESEERQRDQERYDTAKTEYDQQLATYQRLAEAYRERLMAYAQVVGISSVFGNQPVMVVLMPSNQDLIPGFAAELTSDTSHALLMEAEQPSPPIEPRARPGRSR